MAFGTPWSPPRGERDSETGAWRWALQARPDSSFSSDFEREAVLVYRQLAAGLVDGREAAGLSVRSAARAAGVSLSTFTAMEQGSTWPRLATVRAAAAVFGLVVQVDGRDDVVGALMERADRIWPSRSALAYASGVLPNAVHFLREEGRPLSMETLLRVGLQSEALWTLQGRG